jgi:hypothetical protein
MFIVETVQNVCWWYRTWLGFIVYDGTTDLALDALDTVASTPTLLVLTAMEDLSTTIRLGIADSIMVCIRSPILVTNQVTEFKGLALLGHLWWKLEGCNSSFRDQPGLNWRVSFFCTQTQF